MIGRNEDNDIVYSAPMISGRHAMLHYNGTKWTIYDLDSTNGIYVNGFPGEEHELDLGDVIDIFGLRIIVGSRFLSINDGNHRVTISPKKARFVDDTNSVMSNVLPEKGGKQRICSAVTREGGLLSEIQLLTLTVRRCPSVKTAFR